MPPLIHSIGGRCISGAETGTAGSGHVLQRRRVRWSSAEAEAGSTGLERVAKGVRSIATSPHPRQRSVRGSGTATVQKLVADGGSDPTSSTEAACAHDNGGEVLGHGHADAAAVLQALLEESKGSPRLDDIDVRSDTRHQCVC